MSSKVTLLARCISAVVVNEIKALGPVYNKWYMDDGGIIGDVELLRKVWKLLLERALH